MVRVRVRVRVRAQNVGPPIGMAIPDPIESGSTMPPHKSHLGQVGGMDAWALWPPGRPPIVMGMLGQAHTKPPGGLAWDQLQRPSTCCFGCTPCGGYREQSVPAVLGVPPVVATESKVCLLPPAPCSPGVATCSHVAKGQATRCSEHMHHHHGVLLGHYWGLPTPTTIPPL